MYFTDFLQELKKKLDRSKILKAEDGGIDMKTLLECLRKRKEDLFIHLLMQNNEPDRKKTRSRIADLPHAFGFYLGWIIASWRASYLTSLFFSFYDNPTFSNFFIQLNDVKLSFGHKSKLL